MNPVDPRAVQAVLESFIASKHLNYRQARSAGRQLSEHKAFFVVRRAQWLLAHGPAAWVSDSSHAGVIARINSEYMALDSFATAAVGRTGHPGSLTGATDSTMPAHLDLADLARRRTLDPATTVGAALSDRDNSVKRRTAQFVAQRRERGLTIIWRTGAIHADLWEPSTDQSTASLRTAAMNEILDRRLHAAERMTYQISRAGAMVAMALDLSAGKHGPWTDGLRVRMFEYPRLGAAEARTLAPIATEGTSPGALEREWESSRHRRIVYAVAAAGGLTPATAMDAVYTPSTNYWNRSCIYCDHVVSSLHLMSLLLGNRRTGRDDYFNSLITSNPEGYVQISPLLAISTGSTSHRLMDSGPEPNPDAQPQQPPPDPALPHTSGLQSAGSGPDESKAAIVGSGKVGTDLLYELLGCEHQLPRGGPQKLVDPPRCEPRPACGQSRCDLTSLATPESVKLARAHVASTDVVPRSGHEEVGIGWWDWA